MMRVIFCGSRAWIDEGPIREAMALLPPDAIVVHGAARGADELAGSIARAMGLVVEAVPADWTTHAPGWCQCHRRKWSRPAPYCAGAGSRRNAAMLAMGAAAVYAFPLADSKGTWDMVRRAKEAGVRVEVWRAGQ